MGTRMMQIGDNFRLRAGDEAAALDALRALIGRETVRGPRGGTHFMWVDADRFARATGLPDALMSWRWLLLDTDEQTGDYVGISFEGEKVGDEDLLFATLAPFVQPGSWIAVCQDDGAIWRWWFDDHAVVKQQGRVVYDEL